MQSLAIHTVNFPKYSLKTVTTWMSRARTRAALAKLGEEALKDVGISAEEAAIEAQKPFWISTRYCC